MPAVSGSPTQVKTSASTAADLAGTPDDAFLDGDLASVTSLWPNATFRLRRTALGTAPDNVTSIAAFSGNGYWEVFPAGGNTLVFANIAALAAFNDVGLGDGAEVYVQTLRSSFVKLIETPPAGDGATIVPTASGDGAWYRTVESPSWGDSTALYVASTGTVEGAGTLADPITFAELARRFRGAVKAISCTIYVVSTTPNTDPPTFTKLPDGSYIRVMSAPSSQTQLASANVSAVQAVNMAANLHLEITCAAFAGQAQKLIRISASADPARVGAYGYLVRDMGGNKWRTTMLTSADGYPFESYFFVTPVVGDTMEVLDVPTIGMGTTDLSTNFRIRFYLLNLSSEYAYYGDPAYAGGGGYWGGVLFYGCAFTPGTAGANYSFFDGWHQLQSCLIWGSSPVLYTNLNINPGSTIGIAGSAMLSENCGIQAWFGLSTILLSDFTILQGDAADTIHAPLVYATLGASIELCNVGIYDCKSNPITLDNGARFDLTRFGGSPWLYGKDNTMELITAASNVRATYVVKGQLVATTTTGLPFKFTDKPAIAWAALPAINNAAATDNQASFIAYQ